MTFNSCNNNKVAAQIDKTHTLYLLYIYTYIYTYSGANLVAKRIMKITFLKYKHFQFN